MNKKRIIIIIVAIVVVLVAAIAVLIGLNPGKEEEKKHKVIFLNPDGTIFETEECPTDSWPPSPGIPPVPEGNIFGGWNTEGFSNESDVTVRPILIPVPQDANVVALSYGYGLSGDEISLPLILGGKVELCCFEAEITYDPEVLEFVGFSQEDGAFVGNCIEEEGKILVNYISSNNTTGSVDLSNIDFKIKDTSKEVTNLSVAVKTAAKALEGEKLEVVTCKTIDAEVKIGRR